MQSDDFTTKKRDLDAHVEFIQEQLLIVEGREERTKLYSVLDELLAEKLQIEDYLNSLPPPREKEETWGEGLLPEKQKAKLCEIEEGKVVKMCQSVKEADSWMIYYGKNRKGQHVFSDKNRNSKRLDCAFSDAFFYYMDKDEFWISRTILALDEKEPEKSRLQNIKIGSLVKLWSSGEDKWYILLDKVRGDYIFRDDKGGIRKLSSAFGTVELYHKL